MTSQSSAMSITQLCNAEEPDDIKKQEALENMEALSDNLPPINTTTTTTTTTNSRFIHRIPLVNTALRAYENSSSVVKYGAEMIESYTAPIYDKLGYDRKIKEETIDDQEEDDAETMAATTALAHASIKDEVTQIHHRTREEQHCGRKTTSRSKACSRSTSPRRPYSLQQRPVTKSRWQQIVLHAGSAAGTTAAVISEESMKCLRYCLSWLQYAMQHIDQQMNLLRGFLVSLATGSSATKEVASPDRKLASIKKEIVDTLRKVVEVVSKYAGSGLPEQAKAAVRTFILQLPSRWAHINNSTSRACTPHSSPRLQPNQPLHETSIKLLDFGGESIEMLNAVSTVFSDTIERAEHWLKRLQVVGVGSTAAMETN